MRRVTLEATLLLAAGLVAAAQALCRPGHTWWNPSEEACINCTRCDKFQPPLLVLRPCQLHKDTVCAPLKDLDIDWSWLVNYRNENKNKHRRQRISKQDENEDNKIVWSLSPSKDKAQSRVEKKQTNKIEHKIQVTNNENADLPEEYAELSDYDDTADEGYSEYNSDYVKFSEPFMSGSETWDMHTILMTLAASLCVIFFIIVVAYSIYHARQWRLIKKNLQADVEGLSAKINLMMASADNADQEPSTPPPQYTNIRCAYLEQLLVGKNNDRRPGTGNVYIQEKPEN